jgi:glycosyltransferase involved in cell wall biosynthesis
VPEVVTDGETGFLSEVGNVDKMAEDAARLLSNKELRCEMGKRARESALTRYSTDKVIPQYLALYDEVIRKSAASRVASNRSTSAEP